MADLSLSKQTFHATRRSMAPAVFEQVLSQFLRDGRRQMQFIRDGVERGDRKAVARWTNLLGIHAADLGADRLCDLLQRLESSAHAGPFGAEDLRAILEAQEAFEEASAVMENLVLE